MACLYEFRELTNGFYEYRLNRMHWIESTGGPLLLLEGALLPQWHGSFGNSDAVTDYDRACQIEDYVGTVEVGGGFGLVLGEEPFPTTWWRSDHQARSFLVRWVCAENEAEAHGALSSLPFDIAWQSTDIQLEIHEG